MLKLASGTPFSVIDTSAARDIDYDGFAESSRAAIVDPSVIGAEVTDPDTATQVLPRSAFRPVDFTDTIDDISPRNGFLGPGTKNVDLALAKSEENPVYYVQYAHARVCSVFAQWGGDAARLGNVALAPLTLARELALAQRIAEFPEVVRAAAQELAPHSIAFYLRELAGEFHGYYNAERILVDDEPLREARLALSAAVRQTLANGLALLGVQAPEKM